MKIRICYILNAFSVGGAETVALDLSRELDPDKFEVTVLATHDPDPDGLPPMRKRFQDYGLETVAWNLGSMRNPISMLRIWYFFRRRRFDIVHGHNRPSDVWAAIAAKWAGVTGRYWTRHLVYLDMTPRQIRRYSKRSEDVNRVIAVSDAVRQSCVEGEQICPEKVITITNGIDTTKYKPIDEVKKLFIRSKLQVKENEYMLLFVGRMNDQKAPEAFPALVWRLREAGMPVKGFMCGGGPLAERLEDLVAKGREGVTLLGFRDDIPELLSACDLFVSTSRNEGLPLNVMEAMASGAPFIGPRIPQISCLLEGSSLIEDCLFDAPPSRGEVPEATIVEWTRSVAALLKDPVLRSDQGKMGREIICKQYSLDRMVEDYRDLYQEANTRYLES